jgi:hypothetical protein
LAPPQVEIDFVALIDQPVQQGFQFRNVVVGDEGVLAAEAHHE